MAKTVLPTTVHYFGQYKSAGDLSNESRGPTTFVVANMGDNPVSVAKGMENVLPSIEIEDGIDTAATTAVL